MLLTSYKKERYFKKGEEKKRKKESTSYCRRGNERTEPRDSEQVFYGRGGEAELGLRRVHRWKQEREAAHRTPRCRVRGVERTSPSIEEVGRTERSRRSTQLSRLPSHLLLRRQAEASEVGTVWKHGNDCFFANLNSNRHPTEVKIPISLQIWKGVRILTTGTDNLACYWQVSHVRLEINLRLLAGPTFIIYKSTN